MTSSDTLYTTHYRTVYLRLYRLTNGNRELTEDLTQETFLKALAALSTLQEDNVRNWLLVIAQRLYIDEWRHRKLLREREMDCSLDATYANGIDVEDSRYEDVAERCAMGDVRRRALRRLTPYYRNVLRKAGRGEGHVQHNMPLSRARQAYREAMKEELAS